MSASAPSTSCAPRRSLGRTRARYYEVGADISRLEQSIEHTRELRERQHADLTQTHSTLGELASHIERDEQQLAAVRAELAQLTPELEGAQHAESHAAATLEAAERALGEWQQRWESHTQAVSGAEQVAEVERARIEQLENQLRRLTSQAGRLAEEARGGERGRRCRPPELSGTLHRSGGQLRACAANN